MSTGVPVVAAPTFDDLQQLVLRTLCTRERLDATQTPLARAVIKRGGQPCGLFFQVEGPRLMRAYAIWAGDENRVLFYDSAGQRFAEVRLSEAPDPRQLRRAA
jgi:hypothetical protein